MAGVKKKSFASVDPKVDFPRLEEETLQYWKEHNIFERSVTTRPTDKTWTFLDGPPFITGMPHYGTLLASIPKDLFPRFWTMRGYRVRRVWGWDVHGLPAENKVEVKLGLKSKREIEEKVGIKKFIEECKTYVSESSKEWEWYVDHVGRWVDFQHAYKTMDLSYMETVMWVFKQMYEKGHIYKGLRVSLYCPHCATPISNFEIAMDASENYKEVPDSATTYKYELKNENEQIKDKTYILAWSTTPWNKIVTPALAVNPELDYVKVRQGDDMYILAKSTIKMLTAHPYTILEEFKGKTLIGKKFTPHYDYYPIEPGEKAFEIIGGDFVTADEGTGVVTIAAYGEEDLKAMQENNIHIEMHLDDVGVIKSEVPLFGGMYYLKANEAVNEDLAKRGLVYKDEQVPHNVPLCWRCHTRLYYAPQNAWFVNIQQLKDKLKANNDKVNWFPKHFKMGRFLKSLEAAPDWCISRNRYWGSPVPVWECSSKEGCGERFVPGSIKELEEASRLSITDLHKPEIDDVIVTCKKCGKEMHRVPEVLDSWIEAGSASFAERHFPFDTTHKLEEFYPPDFIVEYTGQIRAWFYVLHVIGTALYDSNAFKNVVVTGVILGTDGRKMSKNYGNYPDPKTTIQKYGGDALRLYLMDSPVMHGEDILISEEQYRQQVKGMMLILWNVYNFFVTYANIDSWEIPNTLQQQSENVLDKWILSLLNSLLKNVTKSLEQYDTVSAINDVKEFITEFSTWYIRRSRDRVGSTAENIDDKNDFYETTYIVLTTLSQILAPITPFLSEVIYRGLTNEESVHLSNWPIINESKIQEDLLDQMQVLRTIVEAAHAQRKTEGIKVRQPLLTLTVNNAPFVLNEQLENILKDELNVKNVSWTTGDEELFVMLDTELTPDLMDEGEARDLIRMIQEERKKLGMNMDEHVTVTLPKWPKKFEALIKKQALITSLSVGNTLSVQKV